MFYDVKSLYTNDPRKETIHVVTKYVYSEDSLCKPPIPEKIFKKLLLLVTEGNFLFNGEFYKQVDGLVMGGPLGPSLAKFFLAHLERTKIANCPSEIRPKLYLRYVDDIFALLCANQSYEDFFHFINRLHPNLEFTVEVATTSLPFLDVEVKLREDSVQLSVFRKKTNTNVILNFAAAAPNKWKAGLIFCFLHRARKICSSADIFSREVHLLRDLFCENGYPIKFFEKVFEKFQQRISSPPQDDEASDDEDTRPYILKLPFVQNESAVFAKKLQNILLQKLGVQIKIVYKSCKLSSFFSLKDRTPLPLSTNVVYLFACSRDVNTTYIGETTPHWL